MAQKLTGDLVTTAAPQGQRIFGDSVVRVRAAHLGVAVVRDLVRAIGQSGPKVLKDPVADYMTKTVVTAREADTIDRLMSEMTTHRFRHMPVVDRGRLIGLVSIGDVVKMRIAEAEMEAAAMREYISTG